MSYCHDGCDILTKCHNFVIFLFGKLIFPPSVGGYAREKNILYIQKIKCYWLWNVKCPGEQFYLHHLWIN